MEIDKRKGLIIGAIATGVAATVAGITTFVRSRKVEKPKKKTVVAGPMKAVMIQKGIVDKPQQAVASGQQIVIYRMDEDEDTEEEIHIEIFEPEVEPKCGRCNQPLDTSRICPSSNYSLFCSAAIVPKVEGLF